MYRVLKPVYIKKIFVMYPKLKLFLFHKSQRVSVIDNIILFNLLFYIKCI